MLSAGHHLASVLANALFSIQEFCFVLAVVFTGLTVSLLSLLRAGTVAVPSTWPRCCSEAPSLSGLTEKCGRPCTGGRRQPLPGLPGCGPGLTWAQTERLSQQMVSHVVPAATPPWHLSHALHFHDPAAGGPLRGWCLLDALQRSKLAAELGRGSSPVSANEGSWVPL